MISLTQGDLFPESPVAVLLPEPPVSLEQETIIRWDRTDAPAMLYTASPQQATRWRKLGIAVQPLGAQGWQATVPKKAVRVRRLVDGALPVRKNPASPAFLAARANLSRKSTQESEVGRANAEKSQSRAGRRAKALEP